MMLNKNQKAAQARKKKTKPDFNFILGQILNLDIQKMTNKAQSMKSVLKSWEKKKSSSKTLKIYLYCFRTGHFKRNCYYKHSKRANQNFWQRFQNCIKEFQFKANAIRTQNCTIEHKETDENPIYFMQSKKVAVATRQYNPVWYFDNVAFYYITNNLSNFKDLNTLTKYCHPEGDISLANRSIILLNVIGTVSLIFCTKNSAEKILLSRVWYGSKFDTKLISLWMMGRKSLLYLMYKGILKV